MCSNNFTKIVCKLASGLSHYSRRAVCFDRINFVLTVVLYSEVFNSGSPVITFIWTCFGQTLNNKAPISRPDTAARARSSVHYLGPRPRNNPLSRPLLRRPVCTGRWTSPDRDVMLIFASLPRRRGSRQRCLPAFSLVDTTHLMSGEGQTPRGFNFDGADHVTFLHV